MPKKQNANLASALPIIYLAEFRAPHEMLAFFLDALEQFADGIRAYETFEDSNEWRVSLHLNNIPDREFISEKVNQLAASVSLPLIEIDYTEVENKNWVEELSKNFQPIAAGNFYIYSQFSEPSPKLINIKINPGMAFGTGQHETTYLCLEALQFLHDQKLTPQNVLDLGAGSGILAIAAAKLWKDTITASDNDPIATKVAEENAVINNVALECFTSEGFDIFKTYENVKFDLIFANILMNPLLEMAEDMAQYASNKVILSGFKTEQAEAIIAKYTKLGFKSERIFVKNHWVALLITK